MYTRKLTSSVVMFSTSVFLSILPLACNSTGSDDKLDINGNYTITINGQAGAGSGATPFQLSAILVIVPTIDRANTTGNGENAVDVGIFTSPNPIAGQAGALWFGTNTSLSSVVNSTIGASAIDIAFVNVNGQNIEITIDGDVFGLPTARLNTFNIYNVTTGLFAQIHNILVGNMTIAISDNGNISGRITFEGSSGFQGPTPTSYYSATYTGTKVQE